MRILHLTKQDYKVSQWSGGTTTEVFIWPEGSSYAAREFGLRISSATVDLPESDFTPLPGVMRYIVPLQGSFTLTHPGKQPVVMEPLCQPYRFSGEIPTHCVGKATDFNLMLKGTEGEMRICRDSASLVPGLTCLYAPRACQVTMGEHVFPLQEGDSLVIFSQENAQANTDGTLICCHAAI
jgi:environmental stress-induced protein Ves